MRCDNCIHHAVCALYTFSGYNYDECVFYETRPHGEWIPCSERLPEKDGKYLVTMSKFGFKGITVSTALFSETTKTFYPSCIAWMPLPEPYKKEGEIK